MSTIYKNNSSDNNGNRTATPIVILSAKEQAWVESFGVLSEDDFNPPEDRRLIQSNIQEAYNGEYDDFLKYFHSQVDYN